MFQRNKITVKNLAAAIKFLQTGKGKAPGYVLKYKDDLKVKDGNLLYKGLEVVPKENLDKVLREALYGKKSDVPLGRDSAFHILKQRYANIAKNKIMEFIRKQRPLGEVKAALPAPKQKKGPKMMGVSFETDLIFLRKNDLENANKKFIRNDIKNETYFLTCIEKLSGLSNFVHVQTKEAQHVTPLVIKQCEKIAKRLGVPLSKANLFKDKGGEFSNEELAKRFREVTDVSMGPRVENINARFQQNFFKILRARKSTSIKGAMKKAQVLLNNTMNKFWKKTPNEVAENFDAKEALKLYNGTRKQFVAGDKRKPFEAGQHVRLLVKDKKAGIDYKSYKNKTYSERVYVVSKVTKKAPHKYRVGNKWYYQSDLLKSAPRDVVSDKIIEERDRKAKERRDKKFKEHQEKRKAEIEKESEDAKKIQEAEEKQRESEQAQKEKPAGRRSSRTAAKKAKLKNLAQLKKDKEVDDILDEEEKIEYIIRKKKASPKKVQKAKDKVQNSQRKKLLDYLRKHNLKLTGNDDTLGYRVSAHQLKMRRKAKREAKKNRVKAV